MFTRLFQKYLSYFFLFIFLLLLVLDVYIARQNEIKEKDAQKFIDHTYQVLNEGDSILLLTRDVQNNGRGFVITGDSSYITAFNNEKETLYGHVHKLIALSGNSPSQLLRIQSLQTLIAERLYITQQNINLRIRKGAIPAAEFIAKGAGKKNMEYITQTIAAIETEENRLLIIRKERIEASIKALENVFYLLSALALITGVMQFLLIIKNRRLQWKVLEQATEIENKARRFEKLLENSFEGIVLLDEHLKYIYKSRYAEELTGFAIAERDAASGIEQIHPDDKSSFSEVLRDVRLHPGKSREVYYRIMHKNGHYIWLQNFVTNRLNEQDVEAIVFNFRDVTLKMEMDQQKDVFLNMVSHELKTPVTTLKILTAMLQAELETTNDRANLAHLQKMTGQTNRLITLINDLMVLNKMGNTQFFYKHSFFDFIQLVTSATDDVQRITASHRIHLFIKNDAPALVILGDEERIRQVLINLLTNAVKYSPNANEIIVSVTAQNEELACAIEDFGIGIDAEDNTKVFERFFRSQKSINKRFPGLGIGLYISSEFIKAHRGRIWVENKKGNGTIFRFSLPLHAPVLT